MKFGRYERYEPIKMTDRRRQAFLRKQQKERDRYPLFSDHVASEQRSLGDEATRRQRLRESTEMHMRELYAGMWRQARALYFQQAPELQQQIRTAWAAWTGPRTATYFSWMVDTMSGEQARRLARIEAEMRPLVEAAIARAGCSESHSLFA